MTRLRSVTESPCHEARGRAFRRQLADWVRAERPGLPVLTLPDAPAPRRGRCVSCAVQVRKGRWRCDLCLAAIATVPSPVEDLVSRIAIAPRPWWWR